MAYKLLYGDEILYDPFSGDTLISDAVMTGSTNAAAYLDFTVAPNHLLIDKIKERDKDVELWSDNVMLFRGFISDITENFDKSKDVTCVNALEWLNDVRLRTYTTDREEYDEGRVSSLAPGGLDELFQWYIDEYNSRQMNASRRFRVRINQAGRLKTPNWCDVSSSSFEEVGAAIENNILDNGGYLLLSYVDDELVLDLYADVHEANNQIIDFGVNLLDFTKTTDTDEQYTAIIPSGYTPDLDPNATYYIHIKYSVENPPSAMEREIKKPDGKKETIQIVTNEFAQYIGVYADLNSNDYQGDTNIPPDDEEAQKKNDLKIINYYDWGYFWGIKSANQGYPVTVKDNGAVLYIHVAYATNDDGSEGFSHSDATNRGYIGTYVDLVGYDSLDYTDYSWTARNPESHNLGPEGSLTYRPPQKAAQALTVANIPDGVAANDSDFYKKGDVVYCRSAVARYGYRETEWSDESIKNAQQLRDAAVVQLRKIMKPKTTIEVSAVDLALFMDNGYDHLDIGQAARVRSRPHKVDEYLVVSDIHLDLSDPSNTKYTLGEGVDTLTGKTSGYIKQLNSGMNTALDAMPGFSEDIKNAAQDAEAAKEAADKAVIDTQEQFYQSTSPVALAGGQWDVTQPVWREGTYIWRRTLVTYGDMHTEWQPSEDGVCITGNTGEHGVPGAPGKDGADGTDGLTSYFHIKYSNIPNPTEPSDMLETPAKYIGTYVDFSSLDSTDPSKYTWSKFEGDNGADGIPGTNGQDGKTSYLHVAYANSPDGSVDFSTTVSENKLYMGVCVDFNSSDPSTASSYSWSRIKGEDGEPGRDGTDGQPGPQGAPGADGAPGKTSYFHVKYSPVPSPSASQMTETPDKYIGTYVDFTEADSTDPSDYTWSKFEGSDGRDGADGVPGTNGTDGRTSYLHMAYANSADGTVGFSTTDSKNKLYLGQYVDFTEADSNSPSAYSWTKIKGDQGDKGEQGEPGAPGADGNGIKSTNISYQIGSSPTSPPTDGTWVDDPPATTTAKPYLWTRTVITYDDDTTSTSYSVSSTIDSVVAGGENLCHGTGKTTVSGVGSGTAQNYYSAELPLNVDALNQLANSVISAGVDVKMNNATFSSGKAGAVITLVNESTTFSMTVECTISGRTTYNGRIYTEAFLPSDFVIDDSSHVVLEIIGLVNGTCSVSKFKLERGNLPTSWSPAPDEIASDSDIGSVEDDMNQHQELIAQNQALIQKIQNSLATLVVGENGQSAMTQGPNGWTFSIGDIVSGVNNALSSAETLDQELGAVQGVVSGLQGSVEEISGKTSYITIGQDEDGGPTLELGRTDSLFRVVITNDEMAFMEGTNKIAYISNQQLYIRSSTVTNQLQIGQGDTAYVWEVHDNGNLGLKLLT